MSFFSPFSFASLDHFSRFFIKKKKRDEIHLSFILLHQNNGLLVLIHSLLELIHTSAGINKLLLAGVKRMALRADIYMQTALGGCSLKCLAAGALNDCLSGLRMNSVFHNFTSHQKAGAYLLYGTYFDTYAKPDLYVQIKCYYSLLAVSTIILCFRCWLSCRPAWFRALRQKWPCR